MGRRLQREKAEVRADVDEQVAAAKQPLDQIAGRRLVTGIDLVEDQMLGADVSHEIGGEMQKKARRAVRTLE